MSRITIVSLVALAGMLALPGLAAAALTTPETLYLDTYENSGDQASGPVSTTETLADGTFYVAEVSGTLSVYEADLWKHLGGGIFICGTPLAAPEIPSPGRPDTNVSQDAMWVFARPQRSRCVQHFPYRYGSFQVSLGGPFASVTPTNLGAGPNPDHKYALLLRGTGGAASFQHRDSQTRDNNGVLTILVRPATSTDCAGNVECLAATAGSTLAPVSGSAPSTGSPLIPPRRQCLSRRRFRIRVRLFPRNPVVTATVRVDSKRVRVLRVKLRGVRRLVAIVDLRGIPPRLVPVDISARRRSGKIMVGRRTYQTCFPFRRGGIPRL